MERGEGGARESERVYNVGKGTFFCFDRTYKSNQPNDYWREMGVERKEREREVGRTHIIHFPPVFPHKERVRLRNDDTTQ